MPRTWSEGFDFYMVDLGDAPASIFLDLAAAAHAPLKTHPIRLIVRAAMERPRDDGLRSSDEADALFELEDAITAVLAPLDAIFVGRIVARGNCDLFFYLPPRVDRTKVEATVRGVTGEYAVSLTVGSDPDWTTYFQALYPDTREQQLMANRRVCEELAKHGDLHALPRQIDHLAYFPDEASARAVGDRLSALGFEVKPATAPEPDGAHQMWSLAFHRVDSLADGGIDEVTVQILDVLEGTGGHYDGWDCRVTKTHD